MNRHGNPDADGFCGLDPSCFAEVGKPSWERLPCPADCDEAIAMDDSELGLGGPPRCLRCGGLQPAKARAVGAATAAVVKAAEAETKAEDAHAAAVRRAAFGDRIRASQALDEARTRRRAAVDRLAISSSTTPKTDGGTS